MAGSPYLITITAGTLSAPNYAFTTFNNGALTVTPAPLTVTANNASMVYGAAVPALTDLITGFVNGQNNSVVTGAATITTTATSTSTVAGSPYLITITAGTLSAPNYTFTTFNNGSLTVTPAPLTVTANNASMVYGAAVPALTDVITGFVNGQNSSVVTGAADDHDHRHFHKYGGRQPLSDHDHGRHALGSQLHVHHLQQWLAHRHPGTVDGHRE